MANNFFTKPSKGKMGALLLVFAWILVWNIVYQAFHVKLNEAGFEIVSWAFFISATVFFMQEELSYSEKFWSTLVGGAVGLIMAAALVKGYAFLLGLGLDNLLAISIMLALTIGLIILAKPYMPIVFNNVGFCYFIIALIDSKTAVANLPKYLYSLALGCVILNLGCIAILKLYTSSKKKKALAAATTE